MNEPRKMISPGDMLNEKSSCQFIESIAFPDPGGARSVRNRH